MKLLTALLHFATAAVASAVALPEKLVLEPRPATAEPGDAPDESPSHLPIEGLILKIKSQFKTVAGDPTEESEVACFCSGGVICCDGPEGSACDYGACGI